MTTVDRGTERLLTRPQLIVLVFIVVPLAVAAAIVTLARGRVAVGDPGALTEEPVRWTSADGVLPKLTDITETAGFDAWSHTGESEVSGGVAIADVDGNGVVDVVVGGGSGAVFFGSPDGLWDHVEIVDSSRQITSVAVADLDGDDRLDLLYGSGTGDDEIVWGGAWTAEREPADAARTELAGGAPTTGLLVADLDDDGARDVLRLGYGPKDSPAPDVIWSQGARRAFDAVELPDSDRRSLAAEITDVNEDGRVELWISRDVGWETGGDSVYERDPASGEWADVAPAMGVDLEIDGMGVTVADLTGDGRLDTYLSDLGDNELLEHGPDGEFRSRRDVGLGRIRPPGTDATVVSSSWAASATDINADGRLDVVIANGGFGPEAVVVNKIPGTEVLVDDPPGIYLGRADGTFADVWADLGVAWSGRSRGMSTGDLDGDGDTDVVLVTHGGGLRVLRNDVTDSTIRVRSSPGCETAGATVTVTSERGAATALLGPHTFLGAHAVEMVVGASGPTEALILRPGEAMVVAERVVSDRTDVLVPCPE